MVAFGFPMGLYQMQDLAGLDIAWAMRKRRAAEGKRPANYVRIPDIFMRGGALWPQGGGAAGMTIPAANLCLTRKWSA